MAQAGAARPSRRRQHPLHSEHGGRRHRRFPKFAAHEVNREVARHRAVDGREHRRARHGVLKRDRTPSRRRTRSRSTRCVPTRRCSIHNANQRFCSQSLPDCMTIKPTRTVRSPRVNALWHRCGALDARGRSCRRCAARRGEFDGADVANVMALRRSTVGHDGYRGWVFVSYFRHFAIRPPTGGFGRLIVDAAEA